MECTRLGKFGVLASVLAFLTITLSAASVAQPPPPSPASSGVRGQPGFPGMEPRLAPPGSRFQLGVTTRTVNVPLSTPVFGLQPSQLPLGAALEVTQVVPRSAAQRAGIEVRDVLVQANDIRLRSPNDLSLAIDRSGGLLRLTIRDVRTGREVRREVRLDPIGPGPGPGPGPSPASPVVAVGQLRTGIVAGGGETTGTVLTFSGGRSFELDFRDRPQFQRLARQLNGRQVLVVGEAFTRPGVEVRLRRIILVESLQEDTVRPRPFDPTGFP